jgi:hypothetical protein
MLRSLTHCFYLLILLSDNTTSILLPSCFTFELHFIKPESRSTSAIQIECMNAAGVISTDPAVVGVKEDKENKTGKNKKSSKRNNKVDFTIRTSSTGVSVAVDYDEEINTDDASTNASYEISYDRIIEYAKKKESRFGFGNNNDNNNDSSSSSTAAIQDMAYEFGRDEVIQTIELSSWSDISQVTLNSGAMYYSAATEDGMAKFNFFMNQAHAGDDDITSNKLKIDFWLENFPWKRTSDSYVALLSTVNSQQAIGYKVADRGVQGIPTMEAAATSGSDVTQSDGQASGPGSKKSKSAKNVNIVFHENTKDNEDVAAADTTTETANESSGIELPVGEYTWATIATTYKAPSTNTDVAVSSLQSSEQTDSSNSAATNTLSVIATSPSNGRDDNLFVAFSFIGSDNNDNTQLQTIYWDPETGIGYTSSEAATMSDSNDNNNEGGGISGMFGGGGGDDDDFFQPGSASTNESSAISFFNTMTALISIIMGCTLFSI